MINILFEDSDIIVALKPANVASESNNIRQKDMVTLIKTYLKDKPENAKKNNEPYLAMINRLDQPVEGIMVFALNQRAAAAMSKQLQNGEMDKCYKAVVHGNMKNSELKGSCNNHTGDDVTRLVNYLAKDLKNSCAIVVKDEKTKVNNQLPKRAELEFRILDVDEEKNRTVLHVHLITGRFHQIRCQLANIGYPIINDSKYGYAGEKDLNYKGIALCAYRLIFTHPVNRKQLSFLIDKDYRNQD